jgi:hypothetical protein
MPDTTPIRPDPQQHLRAIFQAADPAVRQVVLKVFELERAKLHMSVPHGINQEITAAIKEVVK